RHPEVYYILRERIRRHANKARKPRRRLGTGGWVSAGVLSLLICATFYALPPVLEKRWLAALCLSLTTLAIPLAVRLEHRTSTGRPSLCERLGHRLWRRWRNHRRRRRAA